MSQRLILTRSRIHHGLWKGVLAGAVNGVPRLEYRHNGRPIAGLFLEEHAEEPGVYLCQAPIPREAVSEGVQSFVIASGSDILASFSLLAGEAFDGDLRLEIQQLRIELDLLKQAFRSHCQGQEGG